MVRKYYVKIGFFSSKMLILAILVSFLVEIFGDFTFRWGMGRGEVLPPFIIIYFFGKMILY